MDTTPPAEPHPPDPAPRAQRSWWSRNWKWFVPTGCLSLIILALAFFAFIFFAVFAGMKQSDAYKTALARAKSDPAVVEALGSPINEGWFTTGKTNVVGTSGEADIGIPIAGPKGKGTIYAVATKLAGRWNYTTLEVEVNGRPDRIDLLHDSGAQP